MQSSLYIVIFSRTPLLAKKTLFKMVTPKNLYFKSSWYEQSISFR